jgi:hypothetical protein
VAAFASEWVAAFTSEWVAGFVGIRKLGQEDGGTGSGRFDLLAEREDLLERVEHEDGGYRPVALAPEFRVAPVEEGPQAFLLFRRDNLHPAGIAGRPQLAKDLLPQLRSALGMVEAHVYR